jgi:Ferritin-like domain
MTPNRITRGRLVRRALALGTAAALLAGLAGCGGGDDPAADRKANVEVLNVILGRQLAAVDAYAEALPLLRGAERATARRFRAQEQEHVDATTKTLRGLEGEADPVPEEIGVGRLKSRGDAFRFLYGLESATINAELAAVGDLTIDWPRKIVASMAANQAQRLVLIRRALGARPAETVPEAFETGETPAPEEMMKR